ncbi:MAG: VOC family protein [Chloroflexi bacterium]|nr:VOC family protein [Chloroflexota bacterium]
MIKGFFGVNVAVKDLDAATRRFSDVLGVRPTPMGNEDFAFPNLLGSQFTLGNSIVIRLIASRTADTSIARFLDGRGDGVFLLTVETDDVEKEMHDLSAKGVQLLGNAPIEHWTGKVGFVHPRSLHGVQLELFEPKSGR